VLNEQLRQRAAAYMEALEDASPSEVEQSDTYIQFVEQLDAEGIQYFDQEDTTRIAAGIVEGTFDVLYHQCGRAVILDGDQFRIYGGRLAGYVIEDCPGCGCRLNAFDLYATPGSVIRNLLRQAGLYPTADSLVLVQMSEQRQHIMQELHTLLKQLPDDDLLSVYAVALALTQEET